LAGMERFTQRARRVLSLAHQEAERTRQDSIRTEHLLLGLIQEEGGVAGRVLRELGLEVDRVREIIERISPPGTNRSPKIDLSAGVQQVLEFAIEEARRMGHHYISTEHLLLALLRSTDGSALDVLRKIGVTSEQIRRQTRRVLQEGSNSSATPSTPATPGAPTPAASSSKSKKVMSLSETDFMSRTLAGQSICRQAARPSFVAFSRVFPSSSETSMIIPASII